MDNIANIPPATPESVWAVLMENARQLEKLCAEGEKSRAEADKSRAEADKSRAEAEKSRAEFEQSRAEAEKSRTEFEQLHIESERLHAEAVKSRKVAEKRLKKLEELTGSIANNQGSFAEEYFYNAFEDKEQNFFGEKFDDIQKNIKNSWQGIQDEYDIVLYNHVSVALVEVKFKAHSNDIPVVLKKPETFRFLFPAYKDFKIYLGLASMSFYPELEQECIDQGIAVIKQLGDKVIIHDKHLKVF